MKNYSMPIIPLILVGVTLATSIEAQTMPKFQRSNLEISGGEVTITNTAAAIYSGRANINSSGVISGTIIRRNFASGLTNSTPATAIILTNRSRVFGAITNEGSFTNVWEDEFSFGTNVETLYRADFHIATSISSFFVKGRATQRVAITTSITAEETFETVEEPVLDENGDPLLDENENPITELVEVTTTNYFTNKFTNVSVSLGGAAFGAGQTRGIFDAE